MEETTVKMAGTIYVPEPPKPYPDRPQSYLPVNIIVFGSSFDPREGYGGKMDPNAKVFTIDFGEFSEYMEYITTAQPGELGKPTLEAPSILDVIEWTGSNGNDIIETIKKAVPDKVGHCLDCHRNFLIRDKKLSDIPSDKPATDTFADYGKPAEPKQQAKK